MQQQIWGCIWESGWDPQVNEYVGSGLDQTIPKRGDATHDKQSLQFRVTGMGECSERGSNDRDEVRFLWNVAPNASCKMYRMYLAMPVTLDGTPWRYFLRHFE